ncbi:MAG: efflux RND transporter periplasmic adaptor subunit [Pirellulaceae bacterium]
MSNDIQNEKTGTGKRWFIALLILLLVGGGISVSMLSMPDKGPQASILAKMTFPVSRTNLVVTATENGALESSENTELICKVRGQNTITWVVESGTHVEKDELLLTLDTLFIEEQIAERSKYAHWSRSGAEHWRATMKSARLRIDSYKEGDYVAELKRQQKELIQMKTNLKSSQDSLTFTTNMFKRGYVSEQQVDDAQTGVMRLELETDVKETAISVLENSTRKTWLEDLQGNYNVAVAQFEANDERAMADASRRDRAVEELGYCEVLAPKAGLVIHPRAAAWKNAPDITEGGTVYKEQLLLIMPDLTKMQVKVGIHEAIIENVKVGQKAIVTLPDRKIEAEVTTVADIASPLGPWAGDEVQYDVIIELPQQAGLKPGMSAQVEIIMAEHVDVLAVPVAAVIETLDGFACWVQDKNDPMAVPTKTQLTLGESNDVHIVVTGGLNPGDQVVLNPLAYIQEAQDDAMKTLDESEDERDKAETVSDIAVK